MIKYDSSAFIKALNGRLGNRGIPQCPFCGGNKFTTTEKYANILIDDSIGKISIGPSVPAGMIVCERCGHIEFFALGVLGLLNDSGRNNDGK